MKSVLRLAGLLLSRLRRRLAPLAALILAACLLAAASGQVLEAAAAEGGDLHLTLILTAGSEDGMKEVEAMSGYLSAMRDVAGYCTFRAAPREEAMGLLNTGEAAAVIELPDRFLEGVMDGTNPRPTLYTPPGRPLESWVAGWLGESAAGMLTSAQAGIYAVLRTYDALPNPPMGREDVVWGINFKYIQAVLDRGSLFQIETVRSTGALKVADHYALGTLICLLLLLTPLFAPLYGGGDLTPFLRRLRAAGVGDALPPALALLVSFPLCFLLFWLPAGALAASAGGSPLDALWPSALCALVAAGFGGACCTLCATPAGAARLAFLVTGLSAVPAGCLLPPALLPGPLRVLGAFSPITGLRGVLSAALGYEAPAHWILILPILAACLGGLTVVLAVARRRREQ